MMIFNYRIYFFTFILMLFISSTVYSLPNDLIVSKLNGYDPNITDNSDLIYFDKVINGASIIGLGESTHGTREFFQMKHRLLKYLVEHKGFTIFAMEESMANSSLLNEYILEGKGDPKQILLMMNVPYASEEVLDLVQWMHEYNKGAIQKVRLFGFDMQDEALSAKIILNLITQAGDQKLKEESRIIHEKAQQIYKNLISILLDIQAEKPEEELKREGKEFIKDVLSFETSLNQFKIEIIANKNELSHKLGYSTYEWILQNIEILQQFSEHLRGTVAEIIPGSGEKIEGGIINHRDKDMAANVQWIKTQNPESKIVLWAHSVHLQSVPLEMKTLNEVPFIYVTMGTHLKNSLKDQYLPITFLTYKGTYTAISLAERKMSYLSLQIPPANSLESIIDNIAAPMALLNLHDKDNLPNFLLQDIASRGIGWEEENDQFTDIIPNTSAAYDGIIYLRDTTGSHNFLMSNETLFSKYITIKI